ncbi:CtsR family transcriptional regulator [Alicyclobacillus cycloheptanicus]|uniref:Transcriptional regulator CtsR n=1 Tax=Alicyclobacillus cycloheptanicus TaxID=1457 RepID=A0ABT9XJ80_9BACL|nr:CtsR family transcriptional regulator [Alicyclobacillus cycloheptanicus]MDQ0190372.1 transcriptional regulator CtsR [Alicyclobacillus cycloheptanicus]
MGNNISDIIERYLKQIIQKSQAGVIELQRSDLAELFQCVPSQINYVISTRFSIEQGYVVESKRGGGGYIRIRQLRFNDHQPLAQIVQSIGVSLSQREAEGMIERLEREEIVSRREANLLRAAVHRDTLRVELPSRDELRARLLAQMLTALFAAKADEG